MFSSPLPFTQALSLLAHKDLLPTNLSSEELRTLSKDVRERSLFSARTMMEGYLGEIKEQIQKIVFPQPKLPGTLGAAPAVSETNYASARLELKNLLTDLGYKPELGEAGSLKDLSSDPRLNLVLRTNVEMAQGYGNWREGQDPEVLDQWPAQELYRAESRDQPRGTRSTKEGLVPDPENSWQSRWNEAGEASGREDGWTQGSHRMIALKNHPIWEQLGSSDLFEDGLDNPYPPFAFNSGMDVRDVDRDEAESLGLIEAGQTIEPEVRPFELDLAT